MIQTIIENGKIYANINDLKEWELNKELRATGPDGFRRLKAQIKELGEFKPVLITEDGTILGGNTRLRAFRELGYTRLWVSIVPITDKNMMLKYNLSDNDNVSIYNENGLANILSDFEINTEDYAVDFIEPTVLADLVESGETQEDEAPEVDPTQTVSQVGAIYQIGKHRLMCGDSTNPENINKLLNGAKIDVIFTDPPYGVDYQSRVDEDRRKGWGEIENDNLKGEALQGFLRQSLGAYQNIPIYVCCNWQSVVDFFLALGKPNSLIVWDKGSIGLGAGYRNQHEFILFYGTLDHNHETNVWTIVRDSTMEYTHPTQKPIAIPARALKNHSGQNVLDIFGGSGSTLMACEQLDKTCFMMELDPKYCDVIRKRYAKYIGKEQEWQEVTPAV